MTDTSPGLPASNRPEKRHANGRFVAVLALLALDRERGPIKPLLERLTTRHRLSELERGLAMQLVFGVLRQRQVVERMVSLLSQTPVKKIDPFIYQTLKVGLYQLFYLDRIPAPAAVHAMVEVCKLQRVPQRLQGFVNGILRQALRDREKLAIAGVSGPDGERLLNHPPWMTSRWQERFGKDETARICHCNNQEPQLVLRVNIAKISRDQLLSLLDENGIAGQAGIYAGEALALPDYHGKISHLPGYQEGYFQVQDQAAQLATSLLFPLCRGGNYLDGCAGVGGKTTILLQYAGELGLRVHAVEPDGERLLRLQENVDRLGLARYVTSHRTTLQQFAEGMASRFDGIFIDAPCSGTGVTGRQPDIRWNRQLQDIAAYQHTQLQLLDCGSRLLAPGGTLVYATCSLEAEENHEVVADFLASHPDFFLEDCTPCLPSRARDLVINGCLRPLPDSAIDGFFAARLRPR